MNAREYAQAVRRLGHTACLAAFLFGAGALDAGCFIYTEDLLEPAGQGGEGVAVACAEASDCPGADGGCAPRSCEGGVCGVVNAAVRAPCSEGGGQLCDGDGRCVACLDFSDCASRFCDTSGTAPVCAECAFHSQCQTTDFCDKSGTNACVTKLTDGGPCTLGAECASSSCVDGRCCESSCDGACMTCALHGFEGVCKPVAAGDDPADECPGLDVCGASGSCQCQNGVADGGESDEDCGGPACFACVDGKNCGAHGDCLSGVCKTAKCQPPSCGDAIKNGDETAIDCGGCVTSCDDGEGCVVHADCASGICKAQLCQSVLCGDGMKNGNEACDDGDADPYDGCSGTCQQPSQHLLLSEVVVGPTASEYVELFNPTALPIALEGVYLADFATYYELATGKPNAPTSSDFLVTFPPGAELGAGKFVVVSLEGGSKFKAAFGIAPSFDLDAADADAPTMLGSFGSTSGLTNTGELLMLFQWDGMSTKVVDLDYLLFGSSAEKVDKSSAGYAADTPIANQVAASVPADNKSLTRCQTSEDTEKKSGGNNLLGHDETSESCSAAWKIAATPTPGAAPPLGFCP